MKKNIIISLIIYLFFISGYLNTTAITQQEIEQQIQALLTQIHLLQQKIAQLQAQKVCPFVTVGLSKGYYEESNQEVKELQRLLKQDRSIYPEGLITGYFGRLTEAALKRFQARYGIKESGIVDESTRQQLCVVYSYGWGYVPSSSFLPFVTTSTTLPSVTTSTTLKSVDLPDLVLTDVSFTPLYPQGGQTVNFTIKVKNSGLTDAESHYLEVYLLNQLIYRVSSTLKANEIKEINFSWTCPTSYAFDSDLKVILDPNNQVVESNEGNNQIIRYFTCGAVPSTGKPDLIIEKATFEPGTTGGPGISIENLKVYIKNIGDQPVNDPFYITVNICGTPVLNWLVTEKIPINQLISLSPPTTPIWTCPLSGGQCAIQIYVDYYNGQQRINESNENNNVFTTSIECGTPSTQKADLIITNIQITPSEPKKGDYVNFVITEKNQGNNTAGRHYIGFYQNDSLTGASLVYGLAAGATTEISFAIQYMQPGSYSIKAKADLYNEVDESNETNNFGNKTLTISEGYIFPSQTGCVKSPAYNGDLCNGYRLITSLNYSSICYSLDQCLPIQGEGTCVKSPVYQGDTCSGYRLMPGVKRGCYSYSECLNAL